MTPTHRAICEAELLEHLGWVRGLALRLLGDATRAEDLTQEVCRTALESPPRSQPGPGLRAWLRSVTRFLARNTLRSERRLASRQARASRSEATPSTFDVVSRNALIQRVSQAVMALPEPYRSTVLYRYLDGLRTADIATHMEISDTTVRKRLSRALEMLRPLLARKGIDSSSLGALLLLPAKQTAALTKASTIGGLGFMATNAKTVTGLALLGGAGILCGAFSAPPMHGAPPEWTSASRAAILAADLQDPPPTPRGQGSVQRTPLPPPRPTRSAGLQKEDPAGRRSKRLIDLADFWTWDRDMPKSVVYGEMNVVNGKWDFSPALELSSGNMVLSYQNVQLSSFVALNTPVPDGFHTETYEDGARSAAGMMRSNVRVGAWTEWHENGSPKAQGEYVHGERHGPWTTWDPDGRATSSGEYLYGMKEGDWIEQLESGERSQASYRGGRKYGIERMWHEDTGNLKSETTWYADTQDGPARTWYPDGQLESRGAFAKGEPVGLWEYWRPDGTVDEERTGLVESGGGR